MDDQPEHFHQSWFHSNSREILRWRDSIIDEFAGMKEKKVWNIIDKNHLPYGKKFISTRWVFNKKSDDRYRARLVAMGFKQQLGVDYFESHSPLLTETLFRILVDMSIKKNMYMCNVQHQDLVLTHH